MLVACLLKINEYNVTTSCICVNVKNFYGNIYGQMVKIKAQTYLLNINAN